MLMDPRERIALWVALVVLLVFVLVRSTSSFVGSQMSFVDLAEFDTLPADLKKMYYDTMVNGVAKEAGQKVTSMWSALTPAQKEEAKAQAAKQAKMVVEQIKSGKGGVMVLPPPAQVKMDEMKMKDVRVQNWMPIDSQKNMQQMGGVAFTPQQGKIAEVKPMQDFGMKMGMGPQQMQQMGGAAFAPQQGKIAEMKPMQMERGREEVKQGKIAEDKRGVR